MLVICPIAGVGSRLWPLTNTKPKALIEFVGKPAISHILTKILPFCNDDDEFCFITGYKEEALKSYLCKKFDKKFQLHFITQQPKGYMNNLPFYTGLGDAIGLASTLGKRNDCFIFLSDRYPLESYEKVIQRGKFENLDGLINVQYVPDPQHYGNVVVDNKRIIVSLKEKPEKPSSNLAISGAYFIKKGISSQMFHLLEEQARNNDHGKTEHQFTPILNQLIVDGAKFGINQMSNPVLDFGRPERLLESQLAIIKEYNGEKNDNFSIENQYYIAKSTEIVNCQIGKNVSIASGTIIENCSVNNAIIGKNCRLSNLRLENILIDDWTTNRNISMRSIKLPKRTY